MLNEMNHAEVADSIETVIGLCREHENPSPIEYGALRQAAADERRIANGEYAPVVHAHWIRKYDTLSQNYNSDEIWYFVCSECSGADTNRAKHCHLCGALMDGKDGSYAEK